jgi:hypothetical protein
MTLCRTHDKDGGNQPILQNAVYENTGEYNKVVYMSIRGGTRSEGKAWVLCQKVQICCTVPYDERALSRLAACFYGRTALEAKLHHSA